MAVFLRIRDWAKLQHYKDRNPPWIKLYTNTLTQPWWVMLDNETRVLGVAAMLVAASVNNRIPADPEYIQRAAYLPSRPNWHPLVLAGFVEVIDEDGKLVPPDAITLALASNMLAPASRVLASASAPSAPATVPYSEKSRGDQSRADQRPLAGASSDPPKESDLLGDILGQSPGKPSRRAKLPRPWPMTPELERVAKGILPNDADVETEFREFCTYWWGTGEAKADWLATWENRCLSQSKSGRYARKQQEPTDEHPSKGAGLDWHTGQARKGGA